MLKFERWAVLCLFNYIINLDKFDDSVGARIQELVKTIWKMNQMFWLWLHRLAARYGLLWSFPLNDTLRKLSDRLTNMKYFEKLHEVTQMLLDQINVM